MKRFPFLLSLVLVFALVLSACASDQNEQGANDGAAPGVVATDVLEGEEDDGFGGVEATEGAEPEVIETEAVETEAVETTEVEAEATEAGAADDEAEVSFNSANLSRLSSWLGYNLEDSTGEDLGSIDSLVIDHQAGQIVYALINPADELEVEDDGLVAVPFSALKVQPFTEENESQEANNAEATPEPTATGGENTAVDEVEEGLHSLVYSLDRNVLAGVPTLMDDDLDVTVADWDVDVRGYWGQQVAVLPNTGADGQSSVMRLNDATDLQLVDMEGDDIGDVEDMIVDPSSGTINYVVWAAGGFLDIAEDLIPVPFDRLEWRADEDVETQVDATPAAEVTPDAQATPVEGAEAEVDDDLDNVFVLNVNPEQLQDAPSFSSLDEFQVNDTNWDAEILEFWNSLD